jgi:hypothetical protein
LIGRGLSLDLIEKYGITYSPYMRRVLFPVIMNGVLYGWQGRAIDKDNKLKMYNLGGQWKAKAIMFYDNVKTSDFMVLTEGPMDALKFGKVGGFIATMGKIISKSQIDLIVNSGVKNLYLALDPDAITEMADLVNRILNDANMNIYLARVPDGKKDFGECSYDECVTALTHAEKIRLDNQVALDEYYKDTRNVKYRIIT